MAQNDIKLALTWLKKCLGGCRTLVVKSENRPRRAHYLPDSPLHNRSMGQEAGEKGAVANDFPLIPPGTLQPTILKSDRLLVKNSVFKMKGGTIGWRFQFCRSREGGNPAKAPIWIAALVGVMGFSMGPLVLP
jgi:hypothetical protein